MRLFNGGKGLLNYVYIDNLVDAVLLAVEDERAIGDAFIVNDGAVPWRDFFGAMARMAGKNRISSMPLWAGKLWVHYRNLLAVLRGESFRVHPNPLGFLVATAVYRQTHIEEKLGHGSRVGLAEGLRRTEAWFHEAGLL
jgi:nucleoside-diphosphate-sugar epimerase